MLSNVGLTTTFKNNSVNSLRLSYMRSIWNSSKPVYAVPGAVNPFPRWGSLPPGDPDGRHRQFRGSGRGCTEDDRGGRKLRGTGGSGNAHMADETFQPLDNYMKILGTHTLQFGANYHYGMIDERNFGSVNGSFAFADGFETGYGAADFLLGAISQNFTQSSPQYLDARSYYFGAFAQDSWRARPNLTLNYGVRYEITTPWWDTKNRMEGIVYGLQSKVFPNSPLGWVFPGDPGVPKTFASIKYNKFAPRFGFAYTPGGSGPFSKIFGGPDKTSIRGGFGIFFTNFQQESSYEEAGDAPYGNFYQESTPSMLYAPYIDRATQNIETT